MGNTALSKPTSKFFSDYPLDREVSTEKDTVEFQPNQKPKYAYRYHEGSRVSEAERQQVYSFEMDVEFSPGALPVIGFAEDVDKPKYVWKLIEGFLDLGSRRITELPICNASAIVRCTFNMVTKEATLEVEERGGRRQMKKEVLLNIPSDSLLVVGIEFASRPVTFRILPRKEEMHDHTSTIKFSHPLGKMKLSRNGKTVSRSSTQSGTACALIQKKITMGVHKFKLLIKNDFGASMCIGLAEYPFRLSDDYLRDESKHIYRHPGVMMWRSYRGLLYKYGQTLEEIIEPLDWEVGRSIEVEFVIDMTKQTVQIFKNGKSLGTPFRDFSGPLQPIIAFYASYEKEVELVSYLSTEGDHVPHVQRKSRSLLTEVEIPENITFNQDSIQGAIELSADKMTLYRGKVQSGNSWCYLDVVCTASGVFRFSFVVENDQGASLCIGISKVAESQSLSVSGTKNIYHSSDLYMYRSFQGMAYSAGCELEKRFDEFWMTGTLVEMIVEVSDGKASVKYTVNGCDQGVVFTNVIAPIWPMVAFYAGMEKKVTLIHFEHTREKPSAAAVALPSSTTTPHSSLKVPQLQLPIADSSSCNLPIIARACDAEDYQPDCLVCGNWNDVIQLPCKHARFCVLHTEIGSDCVVCDQVIASTWNILKQ